jgi:DNA-binding IclR family transcriptional regulator
MAVTPTVPIDWRDERLRYQVLRLVYDRVGPDCLAVLTGTEIGAALALNEEDVLRVVEWLAEHGYVRHYGSRPNVCLTERGIEYLESAARRRQSLRT